MGKQKPIVAIINTSAELVEILDIVFRRAGYETKSIYITQIKTGEVKLDHFLEEAKPDIIVYDIAIPYEENYQLFSKLSAKFRTKNLPYILTTTNKDVLDKLVGKTRAHLIIGKPFDLEEILAAVKKALNKTSQSYNLEI